MAAHVPCLRARERAKTVTAATRMRVCVCVAGGDVALKSMLQWLAASTAVGPGLTPLTLRLHPFGDPRAASLAAAAAAVATKLRTVGALWRLLQAFSVARGQTPGLELFPWLLQRTSSPPPSSSQRHHPYARSPRN